MERSQRLRKAVALISAVLLISAFVLYRAGLGGGYMTSSKSTFMFVGSNITPPTPGDTKTLTEPIAVAPAPHDAPSAAKPNE
ncbi:hypothetical protein VT84_00020 [Gemmata sp. SH-PL17]|uniref:hypothetical protein n=1 Tax=Gemmata sp. SH-PL17 TaxID=1630693 RepID=UPI00078DF5F2|nr:hypothetical protein [Gemmata sp. SH-PL17]AMV22762.1 hypothetical protein VT84_00020 [Gemmata sp. SH-PL17]